MSKPGFGDLVAEEARSWDGTPFVWGQSQKRVGCDCKGFVAGVARELGRPEASSFYGRFATYRRGAPLPVELLKEGLTELLDPLPAGSPLERGAVLLLKVGGRAQHLAIVTATDCGRDPCPYAGRGTPCGFAMHAQLAPNDRVKETSLHALLKATSLDSVWTWRNPEEKGEA